MMYLLFKLECTQKYKDKNGQKSRNYHHPIIQWRSDLIYCPELFKIKTVNYRGKEISQIMIFNHIYVTSKYEYNEENHEEIKQRMFKLENVIQQEIIIINKAFSFIMDIMRLNKPIILLTLLFPIYMYNLSIS